MKKFLLLAYVAVLGGCAQTSCLKSVAVTQLTVTEAAKTVTVLNDAEKISLEKAKTAQGYIHDANGMLDGAAEMCVIDEDEAYDAIDTVEALVKKATTLLQED